MSVFNATVQIVSAYVSGKTGSIDKSEATKVSDFFGVIYGKLQEIKDPKDPEPEDPSVMKIPRI
jgi:hypothetical protein